MYSRGKEELLKERAKEFKPEHILSLTQTLNKASADATQTIEALEQRIRNIRSELDKIPELVDISKAFRQQKIEIAELKDNQKELVNLLKAVLTETYKDAQTQKRIEAMLI